MSPLRGYIGNTDYEWYRFLSGKADLDEVNFWQPSGGRAFREQPGTPFFFKLKSPHNAIAGFGCFARHSVLPLWLAWESFGEQNGAPDLTTLRRLIEKNRQRRAGEAVDQHPIGCIMVTSPVFFQKEEWIPQPRDWAPNIVSGAGRDLTEGEGRRIWDACVARVRGGNLLAAAAATGRTGERFGAPQLFRPRLGQGTFKVAVTEAYNRACAVTTEHSLPVLEAAHIRPYAEGGEHAITNGLLLRTDIHRLFDKGFVTITPDGRFEVSRQLKERYENGKTYYQLRGNRVHFPDQPSERPDPKLLQWHNERLLA